MRIHAERERDTTARYLQHGRTPMYTIYWEHGGDMYPSSDWADDGLTILGWWLGHTMKLLRGERRAKFMFMEGPCALEVEVVDDSVRILPGGEKPAWIVELRTFVDELLRVSLKIAEDLEEAGIAPENSIGIRRVVKEIEELASR